MQPIPRLSSVLAIAGLVLTLSSGARSAAEQRLGDAVREFNQRATNAEIGAKEPPVTTPEIVAAIRAWDREQHPASDEVYEVFQQIAETQVLPDGAELTWCEGWQTKDYYYRVWWVDLTIKTGETTGYTYRIRARMLDSRKESAAGGSLRIRGEFTPTTPDPPSRPEGGADAERGSDPIARIK